MIRRECQSSPLLAAKAGRIDAFRPLNAPVHDVLPARVGIHRRSFEACNAYSPDPNTSESIEHPSAFASLATVETRGSAIAP